MYTIAIYLYTLAVRLASLTNRKARLMIKGHRQTWRILRDHAKEGKNYVWFHAASLGEFEQGRPIMERLRREHPEKRILLTFFSPSGYEVRKDYAGADIVCYLPFDTPLNARRFIRMVRPEKAFFIKYEFWHHYIDALHRAGVPVYSVSSIFRNDQIFFRPYGRGYARVLHRFNHFFVQNEASRELLSSLGVTQVSVTGDTRFDRVIDIRNQAKPLPLAAALTGDSRTIVAGSTWPPDEEILIPYFNRHPELKLIIAPHEVNEERLNSIKQRLERPALRYSQATPETAANADCLIIDGYGLLSSLYRYATLAYVGGGFGVGIHNVPEAAVYGVPVFFGPNNQRFREARDLIEAGGSFEITSADDFQAQADRLLTDSNALAESGQAAGDYIRRNAGATEAIFREVHF